MIEYGSPQWVSGISFFAGTIKNLFCLAKKENIWILEKYHNLRCVKEIALPFSSISDFGVYDQKLVIRGNSSESFGILIAVSYTHLTLPTTPYV